MQDHVLVLLQEIMGLAGGCSGGRGGSMHLFHAGVGVAGTNAIVGGGVPPATGVAWADQMQGRDDVTVCFYGDGAVYQGAVHEACNLAALWKAPIIYAIENNQYAVATTRTEGCSAPRLSQVVAAYGMPGFQVDGMAPINVKLAIEHILADRARQCVAAGAHAVWIAEDLGDSMRCFMSLDHFHRHYLPYLAELVDSVASLGVPVVLHSDGQITGYLPDLTQTRFAALHPLQRTAGMDLGWVKRNYGQRLCLIGNVDSSRTLPYGTPADVAAEARQAMDIAAPGGGYVLASDHSIHDGIPVENTIELFRVGREYGSTFYRMV